MTSGGNYRDVHTGWLSTGQKFVFFRKTTEQSQSASVGCKSTISVVISVLLEALKIPTSTEATECKL